MADTPETPNPESASPEAITAAAAQETPVPTPPGTGEVAASDPHPTAVQSLPEPTSAWAPEGINLEALKAAQERFGCGSEQPSCEQVGTPFGSCRCARYALGSAAMMGVTQRSQVPPT